MRGLLSIEINTREEKKLVMMQERCRLVVEGRSEQNEKAASGGAYTLGAAQFPLKGPRVLPIRPDWAMRDTRLVLEKLRLLSFKANQRGIQAQEFDVADSNFLRYIVGVERLSGLVACSLEGVRTYANTLLRFLRAITNLKELTLEKVHLTKGKFGTAFHQICNKGTTLAYLHLQDLFQREHPVYFKLPNQGPPSLPLHSSKKLGPTTITREGAACHHHIHFELARKTKAPTEAATIWFLNRMRKYGPG